MKTLRDELIEFLYWREEEIHPADAHNLIDKYFKDMKKFEEVIHGRTIPDPPEGRGCVVAILVVVFVAIWIAIKIMLIT